MIKSVEGGYVVVTSRVYKTREAAQKRLNEIEMFKHMGMKSRKGK